VNNSRSDGAVKLEGDYDFIIVGAGSAGCVLANRLSKNPENKVLLLEAGGSDNWIWYHIPVGYLFAIGNPRSDWMFKTVSEAGLNGRALNYPRGKVIGGCSAINAMVSMRGQAADYEHWRQLGLKGWGWEDVLGAFIEIDNHFAGANQFHGDEGEWRVEEPRVKWEILDAIGEAAAQMGVPWIKDFNCGDNEGVSYFQVNQRRGRRVSTAHAFLNPIKRRKNLRVITGVCVDRLKFAGDRIAGDRNESDRIVGVEFEQEGQSFEAKTQGEVILSAGSIGSVQILQRSGIGKMDLLEPLGIKTRVELKGVGENLQDHLQQRAIFKVSGVRTLNTDYYSLYKRALMGLEYALKRSGPLSMAPSQLGLFTRSSPEQTRPNIQFHAQPLSLDKFGDPLHRFDAVTVSACNLAPTSRGYVRINSSDIHAHPTIAPNYLSTDADKKVGADAIRVTRRLMGQNALAKYRPKEYLPGLEVDNSDLSLIKAAGDIGTTIFHPVGTAKMGLASDPKAVVDERLRVFGVTGLRVVDASIMPNITSGNTNTPTIMIAQKGAKMILQDMKNRQGY